jgi:hypothetical protein
LRLQCVMRRYLGRSRMRLLESYLHDDCGYLILEAGRQCRLERGEARYRVRLPRARGLWLLAWQPLLLNGGPRARRLIR